mgnify:CR=1 FL=1
MLFRSQNLIQRGHKETKISALRCVKEMDAGPIYLKQPLCLEGAASEIFLRAVGLIEDMIIDIVKNEPEPQPQEGQPVLFDRRTPEESDLAKTALHSLNDFFDFIRMLDAEGYPRAFLDQHGHRIEFSRVQMEQDKLVGTFEIKTTRPTEHTAGHGKYFSSLDCKKKGKYHISSLSF